MYEDDDDYYDDEEYEEEDSSRGLLIALVIVLILGVLAIFVAISILLGSQTGAFDSLLGREGVQEAEQRASEPTDAPAAASPSLGAEADLPDSGQPDSGDSELSLGLGDGEELAEAAGDEPQLGAASSGSGRSADAGDWEEEEPATPSRSRAIQPSRSSSRSQSSSGPAVSQRSPSRSSGSSSRGQSSRRSTPSSSATSRPVRSTRSAPAPSSRSRSSGGDEDVARVIDDDDARGSAGAGQGARGESRAGPTMSYDKATIQALTGKAAGGALTDTQSRALQGVPSDNPNYTLAWATVMKDAEVKKDYKGHCAAVDKMMEKPRNKYHPEWNLEMAKCHIRNGRYLKAVGSVDRTLGDSFGMTAASKTRRLLLAYEIKAQSRTKIYDDHAKANAGLSDKNKLNSAIQAWTEYQNYASGIGDEKALQKSKRELGDLEERRGN